jgi:EAL domain-containing protein (putative c-di-GMP-specific phosphodiesterase class I)
MGLATVAECIETEQVCEVTRRLGVEFGQGSSFGGPIPLERVLGGLVGDNIGTRAALTEQS